MTLLPQETSTQVRIVSSETVTVYISQVTFEPRDHRMRTYSPCTFYLMPIRLFVSINLRGERKDFPDPNQFKNKTMATSPDQKLTNLDNTLSI